MDLLQQFEEKQRQALNEKREVPEFAPGDTLRVNVRIIEGNVERVQAFEGVCIAKRNRGLNSSFTVRKVSHGEGVERVFPLYSPRLESIKVMRRGDVRRAKLYYLRERSGKSARIREKMDFSGKAGNNNSPKAASKVADKAVAKKPVSEAKPAAPEAKAATGS